MNDETMTKIYIFGIAYSFFSLIVLVFAWVNKYLLSNIYFAIFFYTVMTLLLIMSLATVVAAYYNKKQRQEERREEREKLAEALEIIRKGEVAAKEEEILRLQREKQEIFDRVHQLTSQMKGEERRLELERQNLELERQRFELYREYSDFEKKKVNYALETARQMVNMLHPDAGDEAKEAIVKALIPTLLRFSEGPEIQGSLRFAVDSHRDEHLAIVPQQQAEKA